MPVALVVVAHALDVIGEGGALGEGVRALVASDVRVVLLQGDQLVAGSLVDLGVLLLENSLGASGDEHVSGVVESFGLGGEGGESDGESRGVH